MRYIVQIVEPIDSITKKINIAVAEEMNGLVVKNQSKIILAARQFTSLFFRDTPEFTALSGGILEAHFGFNKGTGQEKAEAIINRVAENMEVRLHKFSSIGKKIDGGLVFSVLVSDFSDILDTKIANFLAVNSRGEAYLLPWLEWLLLRGDEIILTEYRIKFQEGLGRSRQAIMVESGKGWGVPQDFSGTQSDNWLTRRLMGHKEVYLEGLSNILNDTLFK